MRGEGLGGICDSLCLWAVGTKCDVDVMLSRWRRALDVASTTFCERDVFPVQTCVCVCVCYNREVVLMCWMQWRDAFYVAPHFANVTCFWVCVLRGRHHKFTHSVAGTVFWSHVLRIRGRSSIW